MKTSLDWLNSYLNRRCEADEAASVLTSVGFPDDGRGSVTTLAGRADTVIDFEVTSNRGDCLSHVGLARELAAASGRTLLEPDSTLSQAKGPAVAELASVVNDEPVLCPLYTARVITGVKVGPSPDWLIDRLQAVGLRSINNVVDITNFVLLEMGQPLHAFDLSKLGGRKVVIRRATKSEPFLAIDGSRHKLADHMLVIADETRAVAVAGVMGGQDTEVTAATTDILLESAVFQPLSVRATSRALKLASDSSYRFERGVDRLGVDRASRRAAQLIVQLAGGELAAGVLRVGESDPAPLQVVMGVDRCQALLGEDISAEQQENFLARLGLNPRRENGQIVCGIPTFRRDLQREVDLIEEVGRSHGFDRIAVRDRIELVVRSKQDEVAADQLLRRTLIAHGYHETVNFSFVSPRHGAAFLPAGAEAVVIGDERRKAEPMLRPSLLPSLLVCRKANQDMGNSDVRLFETAAAWCKVDGDIRESRKLTLLRDADDASLALRDLRGTIEELLERLGGAAALADLKIEPAAVPAFAEAAAVSLRGQPIGVLGLLAVPTRDLFDVKTALVAAELDLQPLTALYPPQRKVDVLPRFPAIERDLSLIVAEAVQWRQIEQAIESIHPPMLEAVAFLGVYRGKPIEKGRKSVSLRMLFRDPTRTLRHEQVDPQVSAVVDCLKQAVGAELRS
jgi:phenylalanyl-tRNA synthetase beta chain